MGNNSSKQDSKGPPLTRSDTSNSGRSSRSIRSRISLLRDDASSSNGSPKLGPKSPKSNSRKNSSSSLNGSHNHVSNSISIPNNSVDNSNNAGNEVADSFSNLSLHKNISSSQTSNNFNLPPSMMQIEPMEPILLRRDNDHTPLTPRRQSFNSLNNNLSSSHDHNVNGNGLSRTSTNKSNSLHNYPLSPLNSFSGNIQNNDMDPSGDSKSDVKSDRNIGPDFDSNVESAKIPSSGASIVNQDEQNSIDIENLIQRLLDAGYSGKKTKSLCLKNQEIQLVCATAREIFLQQPSLLELSPPVKVVGDVHGQYGDLIRVFTKCGFPPQTNYLFLGDYVDRGKQSLETILLLLCYKIKYPENFFLLRGNHECANVTRVYGFYDECKRRCNIKTWKLFIDTFNTLPIAAIVARKIFCVHGGLSPVLNSMDEIRNIARPTDVPDFGLLNDLLWSDPADTINEWEDNERGVSYVFSKVAINKFLLKFGFDLVCRAHMVVEDGYEFFNDRTLVTVFSAPNYCGEFDNWGAVMSVSEELLCLFELLDPLDSSALKQVMKKGRIERKNAQIQHGITN